MPAALDIAASSLLLVTFAFVLSSGCSLLPREPFGLDQTAAIGADAIRLLNTNSVGADGIQHGFVDPAGIFALIISIVKYAPSFAASKPDQVAIVYSLV